MVEVILVWRHYLLHISIIDIFYFFTICIFSVCGRSKIQEYLNDQSQVVHSLLNESYYDKTYPSYNWYVFEIQNYDETFDNCLKCVWSKKLSCKKTLLYEIRSLEII